MRAEVQILLVTDGVAALAILAVVRAMRLARASNRWPECAARVILAKAVYVHGGRGGSSWFRLYYRYAVGGKEYVRSRYQFAHAFLSFGAMKRAAAELTAHPDVVVHVDPRSAGRATLHPGLSSSAYVLLGLSVYALVLVNVTLYVTLR